MKPRTATILSIGVVLVASAAAITINTNIFSGTTALADTAGPATMTSLASSLTSVTPSTQGAPLASLPERRQMRGCLAAGDVTLAAPVVTTFDVPNIGSVTVARDGNVLRVDAVEVTDGYNSNVKCASGDSVEVEFESVAMDYEFRARVVNGQILTDVSTHDFPRPGGPGTEQPRAERRHRGDDDGEEHGEDHDREHHEEGHEDDDD